MQNDKLVRATFKKAIINALYPNTGTADVMFVQNQQTVVKGVPLASHIIPSLVMIGDRCRVDIFDEKNPNDMVVAYIYGRTMPYQRIPLYSSGSVTAPGSGASFTVAHGLGVKPDIFNISTGDAYTVFPTSADATYIHCASTTGVGQTPTCLWFAIKF